MANPDAPIIPSTDDFRVELSPVRHTYRLLSDTEKELIDRIKDQGQAFFDLLSAEQSREIALARTKIEEAVMWAVKHVTR